MRLLLDTHAYLWWLMDDPRLAVSARRAIGKSSSMVHVSAASIWETSIKSALGKLDLGGSDLVEEISANGFFELPITTRHAQRAGQLPRFHDDPFDRMLIAQSDIEDLSLVTRDRAFSAYEVSLLPN